MENNPLQSSSHMESLNKTLKKITIFFGITLLGGAILLYVAYSAKSNAEKKTSTNSSPSEIPNSSNNSDLDILFQSTCQNIKVEYKEEYIALHSNTCKIIKIINKNGSYQYIKY